jgi:hypothetical protein
MQVNGFRVGDIAYCTDVSEIPESSFKLMKGLDVLVLDALQHKPHVSHFTRRAGPGSGGTNRGEADVYSPTSRTACPTPRRTRRSARQ